MTTRILTKTIPKHEKSGFINVIYGPRRVGKTVLLQQITQKMSPEDILWVNGDAKEDQDLFSKTSALYLKDIVKNVQTIVIDEAQRIPNISLSLKILIDDCPEKTYYVTGSSSLLLSKGVRESLTGRTQLYNLYPLSTPEVVQDIPAGRAPLLLEDQLLYGGYPYLLELSKKQDKRDYLRSIADDYLFKEILYLKDVSSPENLRKLATLLAFQIGSEVSLSELAKSIGINIKTVQRYISLLKQNFILFEVGGFSRNLRKEVTKTKKYYFWDTGIRNAIIDQFLPLETRTDTGGLWENFLAIERIKKHEYSRNFHQYYFWRTYEQAEIDWIEEKGGKISAYEFKWNSKSKAARTPKAFYESYHQKARPISKANYLKFVM